MNHLENHPHAFVDSNNKVITVLNFESHDELLLQQVNDHFQTKNYVSCCEYGVAYINGDFYNNKFYTEKPYSSWIRNEILGTWEPPTQYPQDGEQYTWDENTTSWLLLPPSN